LFVHIVFFEFANHFLLHFGDFGFLVGNGGDEVFGFRVVTHMATYSHQRNRVFSNKVSELELVVVPGFRSSFVLVFIRILSGAEHYF